MISNQRVEAVKILFASVIEAKNVYPHIGTQIISSGVMALRTLGVGADEMAAAIADTPQWTKNLEPKDLARLAEIQNDKPYLIKENKHGR